MNPARLPTDPRPPSPARRAFSWMLLALALALGGAPGCGGAAATPVAPVLVIGIDGLEWSVIGELLAAGELPNMRGLMERGVFGRLGTFKPALSPVVWTSIATGKLPQQHGIRHFADSRGQAYTSSSRKTAALWNMADAYGLSSNVFGWWITWPVEPVAGMMVSGSSAVALAAETWKPALEPNSPHQVHPAELEAEVMALAVEAGSPERITQLMRDEVFIGIPKGTLDADELKQVNQTAWSVQSDETYTELAAHYLRARPADLNMVYLGGPDVVGHRFWRQYRPEGFDWQRSPEGDAALAQVVPNYYRWADELVGRLVDAAPRDAAVIVLSDHGMTELEAVRHAPPPPDPKTGEVRWDTGHHLAGDPGVFIAAGPGIAHHGDLEAVLRGGLPPAVGPVTAVAPTVLALLGIPAGRDMGTGGLQGVLVGKAAENAQLPRVPTHDEHYRPPRPVDMPITMGTNFVERFNALGYFEVEVKQDYELVRPEDLDPAEPADPDR